MKSIFIIVVVILLAGCASSRVVDRMDVGDLWVSKDNFLESPLYMEVHEFSDKPDEATCHSSECNSITYNEAIFYRAILMKESNYQSYLLGIWSSGNCVDDHWFVGTDDSFSSHYPQDGGMYSLSGTYSFNRDVYIEDGFNGDNGKEINEVYLYYLPSTGMLIYKSIKSFDSYREDGSIKYMTYSGPEYFYFQRCKSP